MHDRVLPVLIFASLTLADPLASQATVSPADRVTLEGSSSTSYPLGRASMRLQQLLADLPTRVMTLQGHAYRRDAATVRGTVAAFRAQVSVLASVSPRTPDTASSTFATNHGAQIHTALAPTWISFPQTDRPPVDPAASFELRTSEASGASLLSLSEHRRTCKHDCRRLDTFFRNSHSNSEMVASSSECSESPAVGAEESAVSLESPASVISTSTLPSKVDNSPRNTRMSRGASMPMRTVLPLSFRIEMVMLLPM